MRVAPLGLQRRQPLGWGCSAGTGRFCLLQKPLLGSPSRPLPSKTLASH